MFRIFSFDLFDFVSDLLGCVAIMCAALWFALYSSRSRSVSRQLGRQAAAENGRSSTCKYAMYNPLSSPPTDFACDLLFFHLVFQDEAELLQLKEAQRLPPRHSPLQHALSSILWIAYQLLFRFYLVSHRRTRPSCGSWRRLRRRPRRSALRRRGGCLKWSSSWRRCRSRRRRV